MSQETAESNIWSDRWEEWNKPEGDTRTPEEIDYARVIHSASFRRLQGKTQILNLGDSDFYRTRLTHSLEVAQIASGISRQLRDAYDTHPAVRYLPSAALIQTIGCIHDLGHAPFGHGGEVALNFCMRGAGGFEANGQTIRIVSKLEKFSKRAGSNFTRRTLLGLLKYPVPYSKANNSRIEPKLDNTTAVTTIINRKLSRPPKCYMDCESDVVDWVLNPLSSSDRGEFGSFRTHSDKHNEALHKSFDCSIMDVADDISFGIHDFEDALALRLISKSEFREHVTEEECSGFLTYLKEKYPEESKNDVYEGFVDSIFGDGRTRKHFISRMVGYLMVNCEIETREIFEEPLIRYRAKVMSSAAQFLKALKNIVFKLVIHSPSVQHLEFKGQMMVVGVFDVLNSEPEAFLPRDTYLLYKASSDPRRVICDHISGMTDAYLLKTYDRLFSPRMGSVFDKL